MKSRCDLPLQYTGEHIPTQRAEPRMKSADHHNGATQALAHYAATLSFDALPPSLVVMLKQCVLDTLGVAIGASGLAPEAKILAEHALEQGGKADSTLLGFGTAVPASSGTST